MKIKHSVSAPPTNYGRTFVIKKVCMGGEQTGDVSMGTDDQIMQGG